MHSYGRFGTIRKHRKIPRLENPPIYLSKYVRIQHIYYSTVIGQNFFLGGGGRSPMVDDGIE